jgi:type II secretory pathway pseudopilin PulG
MNRRRTAFTLIEMLGVMAMTSMLVGFGMALLLTAMRADQAASAMLRDLSRNAELADQFRADVGRADAAPERLGEFTAGPTCLILGAGNSHVVYQWKDHRLTRIERDKGPDTSRPVAINPEDTTLEFSRTGSQRPIITVRVVETPGRGTPRTSEISAALGGDVR